MKNQELHLELIKKHINFTPSSDYLNTSIKSFVQHGRASGSFLEKLKEYAEEFKKSNNPWKNVLIEKPKKTGWFKCFGIINKGSKFEVTTKFDAWFDGEYWTDISYEDLTGISESVMWWYDFDLIDNPN